MTDAEIAGYMDWRGPGAYTAHHMKRIKVLIAEVERREREACAKLCEKAIASIWEYSPEDVKQTGTNVCNNLAAAIRARGNNAS